MTFSLQSLEYFCAVSECGSYRAAADKLYRSYQTVYQAIRQLEAELGGSLFVTEKGQLTLTDFGQYVLERRVQPLLANCKAIETCRADYLRSKEPTLRVELDRFRPKEAEIGIKAAEILRQNHPDSQIICGAVPPNSQLEDLRRGTADLIMQLNTSKCAEFQVCLSMDVELGLYMSPNHRLAGRTRITVDEVRQESFLFYNPNSYSKLSFWKKLGIPLDHAVIMDRSNPIALQLFGAGQLVRIHPQIDDAAHTSGSVFLFFDPPVFVEMSIFRSPERQPTALMEEYLQIFGNLHQKIRKKSALPADIA